MVKNSLELLVENILEKAIDSNVLTIPELKLAYKKPEIMRSILQEKIEKSLLTISFTGTEILMDIALNSVYEKNKSEAVRMILKNNPSKLELSKLLHHSHLFDKELVKEIAKKMDKLITTDET